MIVLLNFNHTDTLLNILNPIRGQLVEFQQSDPCRANKEAPGYHVMTVLGITYSTY